MMVLRIMADVREHADMQETFDQIFVILKPWLAGFFPVTWRPLVSALQVFYYVSYLHGLIESTSLYINRACRRINAQ